jgi:D-inositol-3-phosphate glycosyltransferase
MGPDRIDRVAMLSVHTSPLEQPGTGDAGGMNVYVVEVARQLARRDVEVEIFTRATSVDQPPVHELEPGVLVRHVTAGPFEGLRKDDLPGQLCAFAAGVMRIGAHAPEGHYDLVHSHYWLSGQVGWLAADRWQVPLVHTMHTMARVKNLHLASDDAPEPAGREIGEVQVVEAADRLIANTLGERRELIELYAAEPDKVVVVPPGVDLELFSPGDRAAARAAVGLPQDAKVLLFVGRIQPLKAPEVLVGAAAELLARHPSWAGQLVVAILGGPSGSGLEHPESLQQLAQQLGVTPQVRFVKPVPRPELVRWYRAADLVAVPSYSESFGLVAVEAQACGTPVVAADVGGLPTAVGDAGVLVDGHAVPTWADALEALLLDPARREVLSRRAVEHAALFGWDRTTERLYEVYVEAGRARRDALDGAQAGSPLPGDLKPGAWLAGAAGAAAGGAAAGGGRPSAAPAGVPSAVVVP